MVNRVIRAAGIDLRLGTELAEIEDDGAAAPAPWSPRTASASSASSSA